ncbi:MAG: signal peptidase I [Planctomycetota bacterium]|nr:signal peptidase I [Planctomycetota bacterium]MDA1138874.1 signal peptidase I [Planctomycetota bacterium]
MSEEATAKPAPQNPPPHQIVREWGESLGIALVLALILRHFVVEAFKIPTKSMEPTLIGDQASGDKILVSKFIYDFTDPKRGDVVVFKYPEDPFKNYIKRLIGLPGEEIKIWLGDIYVNGKIWRKDQSVQRALWMPVASDHLLWAEVAGLALRQMGPTEHLPDGVVTPLQEDIDAWQRQNYSYRTDLVLKRRLSIWQPNDDKEWNSTPDGLIVKPVSANKPAMVHYHERRVFDRVLRATGDLMPFMKDGGEAYEYPESIYRGQRNLNPVDDLSLRFHVTPTSDSGEVKIVLGDSRRRMVATIAVGQPAPVKVLIERTGETEARELTGDSFGLARGTSTKLAFQNVDDSIILKINNKRFIFHEYPQAIEGRIPRNRIEAGFGITGAEAEFTEIRLERDIYYLSDLYGPDGIPQKWQLNDRQYFVLGDNSPNSKDSRLWPTGPAVPAENLIGEAFMVFWPPKRLRVIR